MNLPNDVNCSRRTFGMLLGAGLTLVTAATASAQAKGRAERWIVTNSYVAEIVVALGGGQQIVALGGGSDHLTELKAVPRLPGFRQTSAEPMLSVSPTRVLVTNEWTVPQTLEQLRAAGVAVHVLSADQTPDGVEKRIRVVAELLGRESEGEALIARFHREMAVVRADVARQSRRPRALFILAGGSRPTLVGGRNTNVAALLELAGAINVAQDIEGFKVMSTEAMIVAAPEFILTNQDGTSPVDGVPVALRAPGAMDTPAGKGGRLITVPGHFLQGMGIFTPQGVRTLARQIHPGFP
ncbi:MAG: ABC transporter substrate-binding protein [Hydrogenophaga sp.]|uniref:heme/hemin ABC transporter substrate-binding protein n=1 Tax=Hydrogenophaga sp. TaxID=1904254 RepID=UPI002612489F|nr:ABC transporter substrate-binding protein [Hydrogenophaga sp.]MDM7941401.1 ABC transporter substrate-binding protein [Hydrogenophaga sp.]